MSKKILSIIVPSYNMEKYLPKCLGSLVVAPELMERLEVLVVNDGSKDRTSEIAHEFAAKWPNTFKVIDKANGNYGSCINAAIPLATGEYVKILDADDYVETEALAQGIAILSREAENGDSAIDLLVMNYDQVDEEGNVTSLCDYKIGSEGYRTLAEVPEGTPRFAIQSIAYKTENLRKISYRQTEGISYTDTEWMIEPMVVVRKLYYLPLVCTHYLLGRAGQTMENETFANNFQQVLDVTQNILGRYCSMRNIATPSAVGYYEGKIKGMVAMIYKVKIFGWFKCSVRCDLQTFDRLLKEYQNFYSYAGNLKVISHLFTFHYVAEWRRKQSRRTLKFMLFDGYEALVALCAKLYRLIKKGRRRRTGANRGG